MSCVKVPYGALWCLMASIVQVTKHQIIWKIHEVLIRLFAFVSEIFLGLQIVALNRKDLDQTAHVCSLTRVFPVYTCYSSLAAYSVMPIFN